MSEEGLDGGMAGVRGGIDPLRALRHDLRTPINHIVGYAEMLLEASERGETPFAASDLRRIRTAGRDLLTLVEEIFRPDGTGVGAADLALLAHRLRTPLSAIVGYAELLEEEGQDAGPEALDDLGRIRSAADRLLAFVNASIGVPPVPAEDASRRSSPASHAPLRAASGRLLVVDDDDLARDLLARRLRRLGYTVETASSGGDALAFGRQGGFDLMLLDVLMPGLSGFDVLRRMKADEALREIPVIVLSALDETDDAARCIELGADDYLTKPYDAVLLLARIGACLEKKQLRDRELEYLRGVAQVTGPAAIAYILQREHGPDGARAALTSDERSLLDDVRSTVQWISLSKGELLLRQGDPSDSVYVLVSGRLRAFVEGDEGRRDLGEVRGGETVGEWGFLSGRPRSATVVATRDSVLARVSREAFDALTAKHPRILSHATRDVVGRLRQAFQRRWEGQEVSAIVLLPLGPEVRAGELATDLAAELAAHGRTLHLSRDRLEAVLGRTAADALGREDADPATVARLNEAELQHRFVLYEADAAGSAWTRRCLRQADRVLLVADAAGDPRPRPIEAEIGGADFREIETRRDLVLLHRGPRELATGTDGWLRHRRVGAHHHVAEGSTPDVQRLARRLAGRAVGLVLGGGGLRGAAHIGVIQALRDRGIPIDVVGGTSAGAVVGAQLALGWDCKTMLERTRESLIAARAFGDYTIPFVSLIAARRFVASLKELYGEARIEDLWRPFYCMTSSLSRAEPVVQRDGPLWRAVRASCAIPGVMPPVIENGELLADGGLLNNLPADVMALECEGGPVIAVDLRVKVDLDPGYAFGDSLSGMEILWRRLNPFARHRQMPPSIVAIMIRSSLLASVHAGAAQARHATLYIDPPVGGFPLLGANAQAGYDMYDLGYRAALDKLAAWETVGGGRPAQAARDL